MMLQVIPHGLGHGSPRVSDCNHQQHCRYQHRRYAAQLQVSNQNGLERFLKSSTISRRPMRDLRNPALYRGSIELSLFCAAFLAVTCCSE